MQDVLFTEELDDEYSALLHFARENNRLSYPDFDELTLTDVNLFVTPKETDRIIESVSTLIAYALNLALHPGMDYEEMLALLS